MRMLELPRQVNILFIGQTWSNLPIFSSLRIHNLDQPALVASLLVEIIPFLCSIVPNHENLCGPMRIHKIGWDAKLWRNSPRVAKYQRIL